MADGGIAMAGPAVETARLVLRPVEFGDAGTTVELMTPGLVHYLLSWSSPMTAADAQARILASRAAMHERRAIDFAVLRKADGVLIGWVGLKLTNLTEARARLGFWIGEPFQGCGYMSEAVGPALRAGASWLGAAIVEAGATHDNAASLAILRRLGMIQGEGSSVRLPSRGGAAVECHNFSLALQPPLTSSRIS